MQVYHVVTVNADISVPESVTDCEAAFSVKVTPCHTIGDRRPRQGLGNRPLNASAHDLPSDRGRIICRQRLGGQHKRYYRKA